MSIHKSTQTPEVEMIKNETINIMLNRKSIRRYEEMMPSQEVVATIVRAGQQAPFASQLASLLLRRDPERNKFNAPLLFTVCIDAYKWGLIMEQRNWQMMADDSQLILLGMQDAALMAENMVIAGESLGLGSCFLGNAPYKSEEIIAEYNLPPRVFPMVQLTMGYPAESPPPRPRYPMEFVLFEGSYPEFTHSEIRSAMAQMDEGYLAQDYYRVNKAMIPIKIDREEAFTLKSYSWTEHICRKWGQWSFSENFVDQLQKCGFQISPNSIRESGQG
jgi:nitroreductase